LVLEKFRTRGDRREGGRHQPESREKTRKRNKNRKTANNQNLNTERRGKNGMDAQPSIIKKKKGGKKIGKFGADFSFHG